MALIQLSQRQEKIIEIVKREGPITSESIAQHLDLTRATLRPDLAILTMSGILEARPRVGYYYRGKTVNTLLAEEIKKIRVKDIKSVPVVIREEASVYDAIVTMFIEDVGTLTVVSEGGFLEGVVSRKDLLKVTIGQNDPKQVPVGIAMTRMPNIIITTLEETVLLAAIKIIEHQVDTLPVVKTFLDDKGKEMLEVVGRITKTNLAKLLMEFGEGRY